MTKGTKGKALVTGASTGIGAVYADRLARRGYDLVIVARNEEQLAELAARLGRETQRDVEIIRADLTQQADLRRVEEKITSDPDIAILVNNAGIATSAKLVDYDLRSIDDIISLNILALTHLSAAAAKAFKSRAHGTIINIGSVVGLAPESFNTTYAASKAYVLALTQSLNAELQGSGVRVQAVLPGATRTQIWARSGHDISSLPAEIVMEVDEMVDAALAGLDQGELVTIPALPDLGDWQRFEAARAAMAPKLSLKQSAPRYRQPSAA